MSARTHTFMSHETAMTVVDVFALYGIVAVISGDPPGYAVTICDTAGAPDPQPLEDDFQESRWWDDGGQGGLGGYRRRPSLNDPD